MFKTIMVSLMIGLCMAACDKGCLKCNANSDCIFCDISNGYFLAQKNCTISTQVNCQILNLDGNCVQCTAGNFLDSTTKKCAAVETAKVVNFCAQYSSGQACSQCQAGYFINAGACAPVTKTVSNCNSYVADGQCSVCTSGYIFNAARNACVASPGAANCGTYSYLDCKSCATGYISNPNLYFVNYLSSSNTLWGDVSASFAAASSSQWASAARCQRVLDSNCLTASTFNACAVCKPGFFLTPQLACRAYPKTVIEGCLTYNSLTSCSSCQAGYFLQSPTTCVLITSDKLIADCASYSPTASSVQCVLCVPNKLLSNNACPTNRTDSLNITNCKTTAASTDTCAVCNDGLLPTSDGKKCLAAVTNCQTYAPSTVSSTSLVCNICANTFYLNTDSNSVTSCVAGGLTGCLAYTSSTVCSLCDSTSYYLTGATCTKHVTVNNCVNYDGVSPNICQSCSAGFYPFKLQTTCVSTTPIANCATYSDPTTCSGCAATYFLQSNACVSISTTYPNCKNAANASTSCTDCNDGYARKNLPADKTCVVNHDYILNQCDKTGSNILFKDGVTVDNDSCSVCKENALPIDLGNLFTCINNNLLDSKGVLGSSVIANCVKYGAYNNVIVCMQCSANNFLIVPISAARSCSATCSTATNTIIADNLDGNYNTCAPNSSLDFGMPNCGQAIRIHDGTALATACIGDGAQAVVAAFTTSSSNNPSMWTDIVGSTVPRPNGAFFYNGLPTALVASVATNNHDNQSDANKNCELYWAKAANNILCVRCKWGYAPTFTTASGKTTCALIADCDTAKNYSGFSNRLNIVMSCHSCLNNKNLLVTAIVASDAVNFAFSDLMPGVATLQCVLTDATAATASKPTSVAGCLVYGWLTNGALGVNAPVNARGCLACQPGFTLNANFGTCTQVADCDLTQNALVNRCSACTQVNLTNAPDWKALSDYNGTACYKVKSDNCLFADVNVDSNGKYHCLVCLPGYWLNYDKRCEKISITQCADTVQNFYALPTFNNINKAATYYAFKFLARASAVSGCNSCSSGFTPFRIPTSEKQCVSSPYLQAGAFSATPQRYILECSKYNRILNAGLDIFSTCAVCKNNKIPTQDGNQCVVAPSNCSVAQNNPTTLCQTCLATHVQIAGVCTNKNIANCATYDESANVSDLLCTSCNSGNVLATNRKSCYLGNVFGCVSYNLDLPWVCNACTAGYALVNISNSRTYCIKIDDGSNCLSLDNSQANGLQGGKYKCLSCTNTASSVFLPTPYQTGNTTVVQSVCISLNLVDKCTSYDSSSATLGNNSFRCTGCTTGFWIDPTKNLCVARKVQPSNCATLYANQDKCETCSANTYKNADETECLSFPAGILRCATYTADTVCSSCFAPAYLSNNACLVSTLISNCNKYTGNYTCAGCSSGFFLANSTACVQPQATNCLTYNSISACATCNPGKGLSTDANGVVNCVDTGLLNCAVSSSSSPFTCTQCNPGYFVNVNGTCAQPSLISKCVTYDSNTTCTRCDSSAVLSVNRTSCNDTAFAGAFDGNCIDNQELATAQCAKCSPGNIFVNGTCSSCSNNTWASGCFSCDPSNQNSCLSCRPGYYQNAQGACVAIIVPNNTNQTTSAMIARVLLGLFALLSLMI